MATVEDFAAALPPETAAVALPDIGAQLVTCRCRRALTVVIGVS